MLLLCFPLSHHQHRLESVHPHLSYGKVVVATWPLRSLYNRAANALDVSRRASLTEGLALVSGNRETLPPLFLPTTSARHFIPALSISLLLREVVLMQLVRFLSSRVTAPVSAACLA